MGIRLSKVQLRLLLGFLTGGETVGLPNMDSGGEVSLGAGGISGRVPWTRYLGWVVFPEKIWRVVPGFDHCRLG